VYGGNKGNKSCPCFDKLFIVFSYMGTFVNSGQDFLPLLRYFLLLKINTVIYNVLYIIHSYRIENNTIQIST
jgi:hypothetical protein